MTIQFRPHHFLCALCFKGRGYSPAFIQNFAYLLEILQADEETQIEIVAHTDSICTPCPNRLDKQCVTENEVTYLDNKHATALQLHPGMQLTFAQAKQLIAAHLTMEIFHDICNTCSWKKYNICEQVVSDLCNSQ